MKKGKKKNKIILGIGGGLILLAIVLQVANKSAGKGETVPRVEVVAAARGNVSQELDATGTVESQKKKTFFSPVNATISQMDVSVGDMVKKGEKLIAFDLKNLEEENQKAELTALSGKYDTQNIINKSNQAAGKQASAQANVNTLEGQVASWKQYVADLRAQITKANADAQAAVLKEQQDAGKALADQEKRRQEQYQKELKSYQEKTLPEYENALNDALMQKNEAQTVYNKADMDYQIAFETWNGNQSEENQQAVKEKETVRSQAQIAMQDAETAYRKLENNPPQKPQMPSSPEEVPELGGASGGASDSSETAEIAALQAELEDAGATLAELQSELASQKAIAESDAGTLTAEERAKMDVSNNLAELETKSLEELIAEGRKGIAAEFDGVISEAAVTEGAAVTQGMQMFTLQSTKDVCVNINVSKYDFDKIAEGQKADITLGGSQYQGTVTKVSRIAVANEKGAPMISAQVRIDNPDENIFLGVDAKVVVHAKTAKDVILVPNYAINIGKDGSFCYVVEDGVIVKKTVETGIASDSETEIINGLEENDAVITDIGTCVEGDAAEAEGAPTEGEADEENADGKGE